MNALDMLIRTIVDVDAILTPLTFDEIRISEVLDPVCIVIFCIIRSSNTSDTHMYTHAIYTRLSRKINLLTMAKL